jgi:hypothetical protein
MHTVLRFCDLLKIYPYDTLSQRFTNCGWQNFCTVAPGVCGYSVWSFLLDVTILAPRIFRSPIDSWKICGPRIKHHGVQVYLPRYLGQGGSTCGPRGKYWRTSVTWILSAIEFNSHNIVGLQNLIWQFYTNCLCTSILKFVIVLAWWWSLCGPKHVAHVITFHTMLKGAQVVLWRY